MLSEITIQNVAVIEKASVQFGAGFNVLTGETGAGKSILIDSIHAILGSRTSRDLVRSGADKAAIWARFNEVGPETAAKLEACGYEVEDELLLNREVSKEGKSTCRINGAPATAAVMRDICSGLIQIHGQHDNSSLLDPAQHILLLDQYAQNAPLLAAYREAYSALLRLQKEARDLQMDESEKSRKIDLLQYEVDEIEGAELRLGEEEELLERRNLVRNAQSVLSALQIAHDALAGNDDEDGASSLLGQAVSQMNGVASLDETLAGFAEAVGELYYNSVELASDLQATAEQYSFDGEDIDAIESRLDTLYRLKQKYGATVEAVLEYGANAREELDKITFSAERLKTLEAELLQKTEDANKKALKLSESRKQAFIKLNAAIVDGLDFLNMPGIKMSLDWSESDFGPDGKDKLAFLISTNPGETPKPLAKIASGGELSRIMLAIKNAMAEKDGLATVIYDEIDTGISGLASGRIGKMLRETAQHGRQVICVTHTAQVAAYASEHLYIEKQVKDGRTYTHITPLGGQERVEELARIISGDRVTEVALANAREMLQAAT